MTPTHAPAPPRIRRTAVDVLRGLGAAIALGAFVIGVPAALLAVTPWSRLQRLGSWDQVIASLTRPDDGTLLLAAIVVIAWAAWSMFTIAVITEVAAEVRHVTVPRLPGIGGMQRLAATLVTAAGLLLVSTAPSVSSAGAAGPLVATAPAEAPGASAESPFLPPAPAEAAPGARTSGVSAPGPVVTVQRGDTLWDLAERHLGDGHRYTEILDLNLGRPQADGHALDDAHWIYPGWQLRLPHDATAIEPPTSAPVPAATNGAHTVEPGDTLWDIAAEHLGDPGRYPEIVALNHGISQPSGATLTDPDVIEPGWQLVLPATAGPLDDAARPADNATTTTDDGKAPVDDATAPTEDGTPPVDDATARPDDAPVGVGQGTTAVDDARPTPDDADSVTQDVLDDAEPASSPHAFYLGLTALAAAGVIGELARRRKLQQRARRVGQRIALPAEHSPAHDAERTLRDAAPPLTIPTLKRALLNLASRRYQAERDLPRLAAITLTPTDVALHLAADDPDAVEPFTATDPRTWTATHAALTADPDIDDPDRPEPYPALVTLGHTTDGTVLLNLEAAGTLTLTGDPDKAADVLRALVAELATSDLTGRIGLIAGPAFAALAAACDTARLQIATPDAVAAQVSKRSEAVARALAGTASEDTLQARSDRAAGDVWLPVVYVTADDVRGPAPWSGSTVIGVGSAAGDDGWTLTVDADRATLDPLGLTVQPQRLTPVHLDTLTSLLTTASLPDADDDAEDAPPLDDEIDAALAALSAPTPPTDGAEEPSGSVALRINVLGPITIEGLPPDAGTHLSRRSTELLVYLALRGRATGPELDEALWHGQRIDNQTRNSLVYRTRQRLGADVLPVVGPDGIYRLGPSVTCDWSDFQTLAHRGLAAGPNGLDDLQAALDLVRDRPLLGIRDRDYTWAEYDIQHMIGTIADVAHVTAQLQSARGAHRTAIETATKGLLADPVSEILHTDAINAAGATDDDAEARRLHARLQAMLADLDPEFA